MSLSFPNLGKILAIILSNKLSAFPSPSVIPVSIGALAGSISPLFYLYTF